MMRSRALGVLLVALAALGFGPARAVGEVVQVRSNYYDPSELRVAVGATVTWTFMESFHTVTADDGSFRYPAAGTANRGEQFSRTFTTDQTVSYHCAVHGGMVGVIVVGKGSPPPPPPTPVFEERLVPDEYPTIEAALDGAPYGTVVTLAPSSYFEQVIIDRPGITLRGMGDPADTVIDAAGSAIGIRILASDVTIERLTVDNYIQTGVWALNARRARIQHVVAPGIGNIGIRFSSSSGLIRRTTARNAGTAGIAIESCDPCDVLVDEVLSERSFFGLLALNAGAVVVRRSEFRGNDSGIVLKTTVTGPSAPQAGSHIIGNVVRDNASRFVRITVPPALPDAHVPAGAGIWINGGAFNVIEQNTITNQQFGVLIGGAGAPSYGNRVVDNVVSGGRSADVAWNGVGAATCFSGNRTPANAEPVTSPPAAQLVYACSGGAPVGVPYPKTDADAAAYAAARFVDTLR